MPLLNGAASNNPAPNEPAPGDPPDSTRTTPKIRLRGVRVGYDGGPPVLDDIALDVFAGQVVIVRGPNGSGKSTLIRAVLGLTPISAGRIDLDGGPATTARRRRLGYVPQRHTVGGGIPASVEEIVATGRLLRRRFLPPFLSAAERGLVTSAIATVGLTEKIGRPIATLSGGQQRRALIARALAGEPDTLVMDEPFAGVDEANAQILAGTLADLATDGRTLLIVTHELGPLASIADREVVVDHGRIRYDGPVRTARPRRSPGRVDGEPMPDPEAS